jgi:formate hydrogenlyase transcriptional activator
MMGLFPTDEAARLQSLQEYKILGTAPEREYEDVVFLASHICNTPIALITLIDDYRQWFKAKSGISIDETPREIAFCSQAIQQQDLFIVPDAMADPRFCDNPLVLEEPKIRFYAGMPLITPEGTALGTVCVVDRVPRELSEYQRGALRALAHQVVALLELRRTKDTLAGTVAEAIAKERALRESEQFKTRMIESSSDCIKVLDLKGRLLSMNAGGMAVLEICDFPAVRNSCWVDFWSGKDRQAAENAISLAKSGKTGRFTGFFPTVQTHTPKWFDVIVSPILDEEGKPDRLLAISRDITESKQTEDSLRAVTEATAAVTGIDFFRSLTQALAATLNARYAFTAECTSISNTEVSTLAYWGGNEFFDNVTFPLRGTPCEKVISGEVCFYPQQTWSLFPEDKPLEKLGIESYLGVPICGSSGRILGHIAVMDDHEMQLTSQQVLILKTFAVRAAAELERKRAEEELRRSYAELERLKNKLQAEQIYLQEEIQSGANFQEMIGISSGMHKVFQNVERVARTDSTVLINGETGTGKELVARAIHHLSNRKERPLIVVNCGALPSGLIESELFGHEKGAFTGATARRKGRFELADNGTIFLDEVGELPLETQTKLLRVLQEQEFERVGGTEVLRVNVRVITATNKNLQSLVNTGAFRSDLFYRLNIFPIALPPLRERLDDVPHLAAYFLKKFSKKMGKKVEGLAREVLNDFLVYDWPGNVRELANLLERAVILCDENLLRREHVGILKSTAQPVVDRTLNLLESERKQIVRALMKTNWVVGGANGAAKLLGVNRTTLIAKMKRFGIRKFESASEF